MFRRRLKRLCRIAIRFCLNEIYRATIAAAADAHDAATSQFISTSLIPCAFAMKCSSGRIRLPILTAVRSPMETVINSVLAEMQPILKASQLKRLKVVLRRTFEPKQHETNETLLQAFLTAKGVEGCSHKNSSVLRRHTRTRIGYDRQAHWHNRRRCDLRQYLNGYEITRRTSKVTIDNIRRIMSSFFSWLEDEDHIVKNPVRRIKRV